MIVKLSHSINDAQLASVRTSKGSTGDAPLHEVQRIAYQMLGIGFMLIAGKAFGFEDDADWEAIGEDHHALACTHETIEITTEPSGAISLPVIKCTECPRRWSANRGDLKP